MIDKYFDYSFLLVSLLACNELDVTIDTIKKKLNMFKNGNMAEMLYKIPEGERVTTFGQDENLPSLPVPSLRHTLERYYDSTLPFLQTEEERRRVRDGIRRFEEGIGQELHKKLVKRASGMKNWLESWWEDLAYLSNRSPLAPFTSIAGISLMDDVPWVYDSTQEIQHLSLNCYFLVTFWLLIRKNQLRPGQSNDKKTWFSMSQFRRLFNTVRVPGETKDSLVCHFKTEIEGDCPSHVVVFCNGRQFKVDVLNSSGEPITPIEWEQQLTYIRNICKNTSGPGIPKLTNDNRTNWAKNRKHLMELSQGNSDIIKTIETALFVCGFDNSCPVTPSESLYYSLTGEFRNIWVDKSFIFASFCNSVIGGLSEHCAFDGLVSVATLHYILLSAQSCNGEWREPSTLSSLELPQEMVFDVDNIIQNELVRLDSVLEDMSGKVIVVRKSFKGFGKPRIQKLGCHPDAFIQMALQLAYFKLHKKYAPVYETATTRAYYNGRTETLRSCTMQCVEWVQAMMDPKSNKEEKLKLYKIAADRHMVLMNEARENAGCDRHLFGLYVIALEGGIPVPEMFTDPAFVQSGGNGNFMLSTSLVGFTPIGGCVAPMCLDGYGVFYSITSDSINLSVTVFRDSCDSSATKFYELLSSSFEEMILMSDDIHSKL